MTKVQNKNIKEVKSKIIIDGTEKLIEEITIIVQENENPVETKKTTVYPLREVDEKELLLLRHSGEPGFVLKLGNHLFYAKIREKMRLLSQEILGSQICSSKGNECKRFSAADDCDGGCAKVRDIGYDSYQREGRNTAQMLVKSKRIEKYAFVKKGYETFNTVSDAFVVLECNRYEERPPRIKPDMAEINEIKLTLANFVWNDEIDNREQVKDRLIANKVIVPPKKSAS